MKLRQKQIDGFPNFWIREDGAVFSTGEIGRPRIEQYAYKYAQPRRPRFHRLRPAFDVHGYQRVVLNNGTFRKWCLVHRLVLEAFVGQCPPRMEGRHKDGKPSNCCLDNLQWGTRVENAADKRVHGTIRFGTRHQNARLSEADVLQIRALAKNGVFHKLLATQFGVSTACISAIVIRRTWSHLQESHDGNSQSPENTTATNEQTAGAATR